MPRQAFSCIGLGFMWSSVGVMHSDGVFFFAFSICWMKGKEWDNTLGVGCAWRYVHGVFPLNLYT
jgi:hypothetical protein